MYNFSLTKKSVDISHLPSFLHCSLNVVICYVWGNRNNSLNLIRTKDLAKSCETENPITELNCAYYFPKQCMHDYQL